MGGWRRRGIDSGAFAWELMQQCQEVADYSPPTSRWEILPWRRSATVSDPVTVLRKGFARVWAAVEPPPGSATACVAQLDRRSGELSVANLGDSGFVLLRADEVALESKAQQHRFNQPFQLSVFPNGTYGGVTPDQADLYTFKVMEGDLLILMTDGVRDNLPATSIAEAVRLLPNREPDVVARAVVEAALERSKSKLDSPFSVAARAAGFRYPSKGKEDDITVVVGRVEVSQTKRPAPFFLNDHDHAM